MQNLHEEIDTIAVEMLDVKDLSFTLTNAMKGCIADSEEAYPLLPVMEILTNKTNSLYEKIEALSFELLH